MAVKPIPEGYHTLTPFLTVRDAMSAIEFYKKRLARKNAASRRVRMAKSCTLN